MQSRLLGSIFVFISFLPFTAFAALTTVSAVDIQTYAGRWYQISANPVDYEVGCHCSQQTLTPLENGKLAVYNSCNRGSVKGPLTEIRGEATNLDPQTNAQYEVDFGLPELAQYWIIGLDPQYRWAVVSEPEMKSLFIISKTPVLSEDLYKQAVAKAGEQVDTRQLKMTIQESCVYP